MASKFIFNAPPPGNTARPSEERPKYLSPETNPFHSRPRPNPAGFSNSRGKRG